MMLRRRKHQYRRTTASIVLSGLVVVDLNLYTTPGSELGHNDLVRNPLEVRRVSLAAQAVIKRVKVRSGDDVL